MNEEGWLCFLNWCSGTQDKELLTEIFDCLLTPEEKESIEMRCLIVQALLAQEKPQRQIADDLKVSIAKITRGSNQLKRVSLRLKNYLSKK